MKHTIGITTNVVHGNTCQLIQKNHKTSANMIWINQIQDDLDGAKEHMCATLKDEDSTQWQSS